LGCFLFTNDDVFKKIKVLSGGEKSRVALAKTLISEANFLLLDEPTNHLDIQSVNILIQALQQYEGTFVTVSHDRLFIQGVANKIWYIEDHKIKEYPGSYDEYVYWRSQQAPKEEKAAAPPKKDTRSAGSDRAPTDPGQKKRMRENAMALEKLEEEITALETKKSALENLMADPTVYENEARMQELQTDYASLLKIEGSLNKKWETLAEEIDNLQE
jgi:ATP-binding cassette subfamily F protein 3